MIPSNLRTAISPEMLGKVTRLFNGTLDDILAELFQNARRAGATGVAVRALPVPDHEESDDGTPGRLIVSDDGHGIDDPVALLTLGGSGWSSEMRRAEDPAGMGLFALAGRAVQIESESNAGRWRVTIPAEAWTSGAELDVHRLDACGRNGTSISFELPDNWYSGLKAAVERAARYYPLAVRLDDATVTRDDFLGAALRIETWRGLRLGVVRDHGHGIRERVNFHGVTVPLDLPRIAEIVGTCWTVLVDVADCPELQLVLPARKEVVETPFLAELREAAERAIYRHVASLDGHRLSFVSWQRAEALGIGLPPAPAELTRWAPTTADGSFSPVRAADVEGGWQPLPADPLVLPRVGADLEQSLARAIELSRPALRPSLVETADAFRGYAWYDALDKVTEVVGAVVRGDLLWSTDGEEGAPPSGAVDRASVALTIEGRDSRAIRPLETDLLLVADPECWCEDPDAQGVFVTPDCTLDPCELSGRMVASFFSASDDRDADSWDTQHERYRSGALDHARRLLLGDEAAGVARIRDAVRDHLAWLVPQDRELRVRCGHDGAELDVSLALLQERPSSI